MALSFWSQLRNRVALSGPGRRPVSPRWHGGIRPRVEALEDRALPCTISWTNAASGLWHVPGNWDLNRLPGAKDDVCIPDFPGNIAVTHSQGTDVVRSLTSQEALLLSGGSLALGSASSLPHLTLSNGTLTGAGSLSIRDRVIWSGGTMTGAGTTRLEAGGQMDLTGGGVTLGRHFDNAGTVTVIGTSSALTLAAGTIFNNQEGGLFHIRNVQNLNGSGTFNNLAGATFLRSTATSDVRVAPRLNNDGTLELRVGLLELLGGGNHGGTFLASQNGQFRFGGGTHVLQAASSLTAVRVSVVNANVTVNGTYAVSRGTTVFGATMTFTPAATVTDLGEELYVYNGTADLSSGEDHTVRFATFSGGTSGGNVTGSDGITITEHLAWYTGRMSGTGTTTVLGVLAIDPVILPTTLARTLNNYGTATYSSHFGGFSIANQGVFNNLPGATFDITSNQPQIGGNGVFNNSEGATFRLMFGEAFLPWVFNNSGLVEVQRDRLVLRGGGSHRGTFVTVPGAVLEFGGGTHDFQSTSGISAFRVLFSAGLVNFSGAYDVSDETRIDGAAVTFNPSASVSNVGATLTMRGNPTANFNSGEVLVASTLYLVSGTLTGSDDLYALDTFIWSDNAMIGSGTTYTFGEMILRGANTTLGRTLMNFGTATWLGVGNMAASPGAAFLNLGTFEVQNDQSFSSSCQAGFYNGGTFRKTASYGITTIGLVFFNDGKVDVQTGTVNFACGLSPGGSGGPAPEADRFLMEAGGDILAALVLRDENSSEERCGASYATEIRH